MKQDTQALTVSVEIDFDDEALQERELRMLETYAADLIRAVIQAKDNED